MGPKPDLLPKCEHGATRHIDVGMPIHPSQLSLDSVRGHAVVGIHPHHVRGGRRSNGGVESGHDASVGVKPDDAETLDARMKVLFRNVQPIDYHRVTYTQHFATNMDYNHSNYDDFEDMHNLWWSKVKNVDNGRKSIVLNTTATHREQFKDYK